MEHTCVVCVENKRDSSSDQVAEPVRATVVVAVSMRLHVQLTYLLTAAPELPPDRPAPCRLGWTYLNEQSV